MSEAAGLQQLIDQYAGYGPFVASFLTNFLATFGDKGQLAVITLATTYDARKVFVGAVSAFACWNAIEVAVGTNLVRVVPAGVMPVVTGGLFLAFGAWSAYQAVSFAADSSQSSDDLVRSMLPERVFDRIEGRSAFAVAFVTIAVAEFGDKTQLLTVNLSATFPSAPAHVFFGAWIGLALRTGIDAFVGEAAERVLPTVAMQAGAAAIFVAVGLFELGVLSGTGVLVVAAVAVLGALSAAARRAFATEA